MSPIVPSPFFLSDDVVFLTLKAQLKAFHYKIVNGSIDCTKYIVTEQAEFHELKKATIMMLPWLGKNGEETFAHLIYALPGSPTHSHPPIHA